MRRPTRFLTVLPALLLALSALLAVAGCDTTSDQDEADREQLLGAWSITGLRVDGQNFDARIENEYPNRVLFQLRHDDAGRDLFLIQSKAADGDTLLSRQGTFDVDAEDSELQLEPFGANFGSTSLFYDFEVSETESPERINLTADTDRDGQALLGLLKLGGFGDVESVEITIERRGNATPATR